MNTLNLTDQHLQIIEAGLIKLPYGQVAALIAEINRQLAEQHKLQEQALDNK